MIFGRNNFNIRSQISVVELILVISLFSFTLISITNFQNVGSKVDYKFQIQSALDAIYYNSSNLQEIVLENLSSGVITSNWTLINNTLKNMFLNYELIISNNSKSKLIFSCDGQYNKFYDERITIGLVNGNYEFRKIILGVCY